VPSPEVDFKDHFSIQAATYAKARPRYPDTLYEWLAAQAPACATAWDAGCGNGQAALALAAHFQRVIATDPSAAQLRQAPAHARVEYRLETAETPGLDDDSVDLITVAQALHWFDPDRFHAAARRVLKNGGVIAAWTYALSRVDAAVDAVFMRLHDELLVDYWPAERRHVANGYRDLPFPYEPVTVPAFDMQVQWTLPQYLDYLRSWSASQRFLADRGEDAVSLVAAAFAQAWGDPARPRTIDWPLSVRVGRKA
jgi:SAM-dependent methyltransferase